MNAGHVIERAELCRQWAKMVGTGPQHRQKGNGETSVTQWYGGRVEAHVTVGWDRGNSLLENSRKPSGSERTHGTTALRSPRLGAIIDHGPDTTSVRGGSRRLSFLNIHSALEHCSWEEPTSWHESRAGIPVFQ